MKGNENATLKARIDDIRHLCGEEQGNEKYFEAAMLAQAVLHDTVGFHPIMADLKVSLEESRWDQSVAASRAVVRLFDEGCLTSPGLGLVIAHEIEGDILDIAQSQVNEAITTQDSTQKQLHLAISAFLAGAMLEDALRRLCEANGIAYDIQHTSIEKLRSALYQPKNNINVISKSETKQMATWGDTRNNADHGRFSDITDTDVTSMVNGIRAFIKKHLP